MRGNITYTNYTKSQSIKYAVEQSFLMNDFIESFLMIFGQNKYTNLKDIEKYFVTKQILVSKKW